MTNASSHPSCVMCQRTATIAIDPPRRTFTRRPVSTESSCSIIAVLPNISLCDEHGEEVQSREVSIGWCDDEQCRQYGEKGAPSPCGQYYKELRS